MPLATVTLDETWQTAALAYLRRSPYRNALPLSNITQLRQHCDVVLVHSGGLVQGLASHYRSLPFLGLTFVAELDEAMPPLLGALAELVPALRDSPLTTVIPEQRVRQLATCAVFDSLEIEYQLVVEPETLRPVASPMVRRLRADDLPAMGELAALGELVAWRPEVIAHGPAFGAFDGPALVAMAATHFATPDVVEIGNIVTHPAYRRRGLASACTSALAQACFSLAPRVFLMVMAENSAALAAYSALGFWPAERYAFARFRLTL
jgi:ribosomal protein S18 acetylase RimI-like enzyme